jgi:hypothetical protein
MIDYKNKAIDILKQLENKETADKLALLVEYIIDRKN